jgi:FtsP/CotA-like multicopper oxidase with cupredoxin domain
MCTAAASVGALALESIPLPAIAARGGGGGTGTVTRYPLHFPPSASPSGFSLTAAPALVNLATSQSPSLSSALAYNGFVPGPTFRANSGDNVYVSFANGLADETTVHWHGMLVETDQDGQPQDLILPGGSRVYEYPIVQRAALNWYHPHPHMMTGEQVCLGLAGAFIVNDAEEASLGLPAGKYEVPLIIRDANFDKSGNLLYNPRTTGFDGSTPLVNGTRSPYLEVDRAIYRLRVLNGANARLFRLVLSNGSLFTLIGNDGGLLAAPANVAEIEFSPGERLDLLVNFQTLAGAHVMLRDLNSGWDLLEFRVGTSTQIAGTVPTGTLSTIAPLSSPVLTRYFSFDGMSKINGREFDLNRIDFTVPFGQTELWRFTTNGNAPHPVHVHGASFQVKSRTGGRGKLFPWESGWKDTVLLQDQESVDVLIRFDQYRGRYLIHCHKLEHEDMGMMANFEVI